MSNTQFIKSCNFHSIPRQAKRLDERHTSESMEVERCGMTIIVDTGVFQTDGDSELMAESVRIEKDESFLEVGCGSGIVSLVVAQKAASGIGVDINERAVECSKRNAQAHNITNVEFLRSDVFENVTGVFDVIICNPPYTSHEVRDDIDRMFWDPENEMKRKFFSDVGKHLKHGGRIYFGWANFADIDV